MLVNSITFYFFNPSLNRRVGKVEKTRQIWIYILDIVDEYIYNLCHFLSKFQFLKLFILKSFFFSLHFLSSSLYTTIPGTGDVLILLIGYPVYHSEKEEEKRRRRSAPVCTYTRHLFFFPLSLLFLCRNKKRRRRKREKEDGCSRQKDPCVCKKEGSSFRLGRPVK